MAICTEICAEIITTLWKFTLPLAVRYHSCEKCQIQNIGGMGDDDGMVTQVQTRPEDDMWTIKIVCSCLQFILSQPIHPQVMLRA